ncbi:YqaA family protein [Paenibacillus sp. strain BS8-2]
MFQAIIDFLEDYGPWGLFVHSFLDAIIFPIPAFFTQVSLSLLNPSSALWLATVGYIACLLGTPIGYMIGKLMGKSVLYRILKKEWIDAATDRFQKSGEAAILIGSFTPIPFKVFTILSGCLNFPLWRLIGYAALGRAVKFYVVGALFYIFGRTAETMVKDVSLYIFLGGVPLIVLFLFIRSKRRKRKQAKLDSEMHQTSHTTQQQPSNAVDISNDI